MKTLLKSLTLLTILFSLAIDAGAQQRNFQNSDRGQRFDRQEWPGFRSFAGGNIFINSLNLSEDQKTRIGEIRLAGQKEMLELRNQLGEKNARLQTLTTAENYNEAEVQKTIKEIGELRTNILEKRTEHRQQVRSLLNDEQRIQFDTFHQGRFKGNKQRGCFRR